MAYSVAANTRLAGSAQGSFLDDLTNPNVGQWPKTQAIKRITRIAVFAGSIIDSVRVSYDVEHVASPITVKHGGDGGDQVLDFPIDENEKLIAVYGRRLIKPGIHGDRNIIRLSFVVANFFGDVPTIQVNTASGWSTDPSEKFDLSWPLTAVSSFTFQPQGMSNSYLQGIGFSKVLDQADPNPDA